MENWKEQEPVRFQWRQEFFQLARAYDGIDLRNIFADLLSEALDQASGDDEFFRLAGSFMTGHFEDGINRFLLGAVDKRAGVDDDDIGVLGAAGEFSSRASQQTHHDFAIDQVFGATQADEAHFLGSCRMRLVRRFGELRFGGTADSKILYRHTIFLF